MVKTKARRSCSFLPFHSYVLANLLCSDTSRQSLPFSYISNVFAAKIPLGVSIAAKIPFGVSTAAKIPLGVSTENHWSTRTVCLLHQTTTLRVLSSTLGSLLDSQLLPGTGREWWQKARPRRAHS